MSTRCEECEGYNILHKKCNDCGSFLGRLLIRANFCVPYNLCIECLIAFKVENTVDLIKIETIFSKWYKYIRWRLGVKTATAMPLLEARRVNHATHIS